MYMNTRHIFSEADRIRDYILRYPDALPSEIANVLDIKLSNVKRGLRMNGFRSRYTQPSKWDFNYTTIDMLEAAKRFKDECGSLEAAEEALQALRDITDELL